MGTFITDGSAVLPPVKSDVRAATVPPAADEWAAGDANQLREALLDLRSEALGTTATFAAGVGWGVLYNNVIYKVGRMAWLSFEVTGVATAGSHLGTLPALTRPRQAMTVITKASWPTYDAVVSLEVGTDGRITLSEMLDGAGQLVPYAGSFDGANVFLTLAFAIA